MVKVQKGFTLIELMIVIAIIGILAAVAVPQYSQYTKRAKYSEVKLSVSPIKAGVEDCYQRNAGVAACNASAATATIPGKVTDNMLTRAASAALVGSVALTDAAGSPVITVAPAAAEGFTAADTYIITGTVAAILGDNAITNWVESGVGCDNGYC